MTSKIRKKMPSVQPLPVMCVDSDRRVINLPDITGRQRGTCVLSTGLPQVDYLDDLTVIVSRPCARGPVSALCSNQAKEKPRKPRIEKIHIPRA